MKKIPVGLQLYSVREEAEKDLSKTLKKVKEVGYDFVELAGLCGKSFAEMKNALDEAGIPAISAHVPVMELEADLENVVAGYAGLGCRYIALPYLPGDLRPGKPGFDKVMELIPGVGKTCKEHGITLLYHNHDFEFARIGGRYALDYIYETVPPELLQTEIDCCWVKVAGEDPTDYVRKYAGRCPVVHLKDFYMEGRPQNMYELIGIETAGKEEKEGRFEFRPVGFGMQIMPELLEAAVESGAEYLVVEQDASAGRTPVEAVTMSRRYLELLGF